MIVIVMIDLFNCCIDTIPIQQQSVVFIFIFFIIFLLITSQQIPGVYSDLTYYKSN